MAFQNFAVIETTNPAKGTATITYDPMGGAPDSFKRKLRTIYLDAPPWNHTGRQPYAWDYTPPADLLRGFAVLTVVLDRNVRMLWTKADWFNGNNYGPDNPRLILIRAQDSSLIPPRHAPVLAHQIVAAPTRGRRRATTRSRIGCALSRSVSCGARNPPPSFRSGTA